MQKLWTGLYGVVSLVLVGCGGAGSGGGAGSHANDTTIPTSGIYDASDSDPIKFLKVMNYARGIARECKNTDGTHNEPSQGYFSAVSPLALNNDLYNAAYEHSKDMADHSIFSHTGSDGSTLKDRAEANGYVGWTALGENIAGGQATIEETIHALLESPEHCANIMNPRFKEAGMAYYEKAGTTYRHYWTQDFGAK